MFELGQRHNLVAPSGAFNTERHIMKSVNVTVSGTAGSGKTTVLAAIEHALESLDAKVTVMPGDETPENRRLRTGADLSNYLVELSEVQERRRG